MNFKLALFKRLLPCLLSLTSFSVSAQKKERAHIDSLLKQLPAAREDTNKANLLRRLGDGYLNRLKTDSALLYYQQEGYLSQKIHWKKGVALANISVGCCYIYIKKDFAGAQNYLDKALRLSFEIKDYRAAYYAARYIAAAMVFQNRAPENIKFLVSFAARLKEANQTGFLADTYFLIGDYSKYFSSYSDAMDYYDRALKLEETAHRQYLKSPDILSIASFYADLHHLDKAKTFLQRAVAMDENAHNLPALVDDYSGLAHYADAAHDEAAVMAYDNKALQMAQKANNRYMLCSIENEISWRYFLKKDYDRAFIHARNAISYGTVGSSALAYAYGTMGCIYRDAPDSVIAKTAVKPGGRYPKSVALLTEAINYGKAYVDFQLSSDCTKELSLTYQKMGRYADAYKTYKTYITQRDSTDSLKNEKAVLLKEAQVNYSHKEDSLKYQQNITNGQLKQKKQQSYFFIAGIAGLLILSLFIGLNYRNQRKSNKLLAETNDLVTNANHELSEQREEITAQRDELSNTLSELRSAQTQLIQSEKMASLGELTAGIAHEIQNPLNFVNNFSEVNKEMLEELKAESKKVKAERDKQLEIDLINDLIENESKIIHHGKRADAIVKGMLEHSRVGTGEHVPTDLNALADEFLRLSYHGLRAKDKMFNADLVTSFDADLPKANVAQQDISRVLLNLFNNAFYAVNQKMKTAGPGYKPEVTVMTASEKGNIVIKVKDNGNGIPGAIKEKIMQPFFTTKPTGEGTGLGLSLSYDIVVKGHGGTINVETKEGEYTEFIINFPFLKLT